MTKQVLEKNYNVRVSNLAFKEHFTHRADFAVLGPYKIYRFKNDGDYVVVYKTNIIFEKVDLSKYV